MTRIVDDELTMQWKKLVGGDSIAMTMMKCRSTPATSSLTSYVRDQREEQSLLEPKE